MFGKRNLLKLIALLFFSLTGAFYIAFIPITNATFPAKIKVLNPKTGNENFTYFTNTTKIGDKFNATIWVFNVSELFSYQIWLFYDQNVINATRAWIPEWSQSWPFYNKEAVVPEPVFGMFLYNETYYHYVQLGSALLEQATFSGNGLLAIIEFEVVAIPEANGCLKTELNIKTDDTYLLKDPWTEIPADKINAKYSLKWLEPTLAIAPPIQIATNLSETFSINITIENVTVSDRLIALSLTLTYNNTLLNLTEVTEGQFLSQFNNTPVEPYTEFNYTLTSDGIIIQNKLKPDPQGRYIIFPKGSGTLAILKFELIYQPLNKTLSPLKLLNITLLDSEGKTMRISPPRNGLLMVAGQKEYVLLIMVKPKMAPIGSTICINGKLLPPINKVNITIYIRPKNGRWRKLTAVTAKNGSFLYNWTAVDIGNYELKANYTEAESNIEILNITKIKTEISITVNPSIAELNSTIKIYGKIYGVKSKVEITLYYRKVGHMPQKLAVVESDSEGKYYYKWMPETTGTYVIHSYWQGNETYYPAKSSERTIVIEKYSSSITLQVYPPSPLLNSEVTINGTIIPARGGVKILIFYREVNSSSWSKLTALTDNNGVFKVIWIASKNTTFQFYAWWGGDEYSKPCSSGLISLEVHATTAQPPEGGIFLPYAILAAILAIGALSGIIYYIKTRNRHVSEYSSRIIKFKILK